jgi:hypothetical protein
MLAPIVEFVPLAVWLSVLALFLAGVFARAEWPIFMLAVLAPLPTLWYPAQQFPLGKDTMDLLVAGALIGVWTNKSGLLRAPNVGGCPSRLPPTTRSCPTGRTTR